MSLPLPRGFEVDLADAVANELRLMRERAGLSQAEVARRTGIHRPIVSRIERGLHTASLETCARFATACGGNLLDVARAIDVLLGWRKRAA